MSEKSAPPQITTENYNKYIVALQDYYSLKNKYYQKFESKKKKIIKSDETKENKKLLIEALKQNFKCVRCKKLGGTLFTEEGNVLKAICNANDKKCKLNIEINKSISLHIPSYLEVEKKRQEDIKREITQYKLDMLFGLQQEDVVLQEFKNLREQFKQSTDTLNMLQDEYDEENNMISVSYEKQEDAEIFIWLNGPKENINLINLFELNDTKIENMIIERGEKKRQYIKKIDYIDYLNIGLNKILSLYKENIKEYETTKNISILTDSMEIYKTKILPILHLIRFIKYPVSFIEKINNTSGFSKKMMPTFHIHNNKISIQNEIFEHDYKIKSNKK